MSTFAQTADVAATAASPGLEEDAGTRAAIDTIRTLAMDAVEAANSGHPGMPMAMAPSAYLLYARFLRHNPADPWWPDRDRFLLSAGHGSMLLYAVLHLAGYDLSLDELRSFRQWGSRTPGHPERVLGEEIPGVETTTGPLGQGFANGVGMAMAERFLRQRYGEEVMDHRIYAICSDGDLMEGLSSEAASLAGHLGLGRLVYLYDDNHISIDGDTALSFDRENVPARFEAYGWDVQSVADANDLDALATAIDSARAQEERPSLICVRSVIAWPAPGKRGTAGAHGAPLGGDEVRATKSLMGLDPDTSFVVPVEARDAFGEARRRGAELQREWEQRSASWRERNPLLAAEWERAWSGRPAAGVGDALPRFDGADGAIATRAAGGAAMQAFGEHVPTMIGGSADLAESTKTEFKAESSFTREHAGRNVHWGVREHAMGAAVNGLALHGGIVKPYGSTFLVFSDYMRPAIRLSALMQLPTVWVFTHDSIGLGEDGPTHQPVEQLAALRAIPGLTVIRPADANETSEAWRVVLEDLAGPACLLLSRQGLPVIDRSGLGGAEGVARGGYVLAEADGPCRAVLAASGSEVIVALQARAELAGEGIGARVVSLPSWELLDAQPPAYREQLFPESVPVISVEAGVTQGWERYAGHSVSVDRFGASAPGDQVMDRLGISPSSVAAAARAALRAE